MMRSVLVGLGLCAGTHGATAQGGWLVDQDSIQLGIFSAGARSVRETPNGFVLFSYQVNPNPPNRTGIQIKQLDPDGLQNDFAIYGLDTINRNIGYIDPVANCSNDGYAFPVVDFLGGGNTYSKGHLFRTNEWGDTLWTKTLYSYAASDSLIVLMRSITQCPDSGFCIAGAIDPPDASATGYLIRTNAAGDTLWTRAYPQLSEILDIEPYWDGGYILSGFRFIDPDVVTMRISSTGNVLWTRYSGQNSGNTSSLMANDSGIVTLSVVQDNSSDGSVQLTKWNGAGQLLWQREWFYGYSRATYDLEELADGSLICTMLHAGPASLFKFDQNGDSLWLRDYLWFYTNILYDVEPTTDGGFVAAGRAFQSIGDPHPGLETIIVLKTDSFGCVVPGCQYVGIETQFMGLEDAIKAYPNPSTGAFTLELDLPENAPISGDLLLQVFDVQGRQVVARSLGRDRYQRINVDLADEPAGLYSAHLSDGKRILTGVRLVVSPP